MPLISVLKNITDPKTFVDVSGSDFKVSCHPSYYTASTLSNLDKRPHCRYCAHQPRGQGDRHLQHLLRVPDHPWLHGGGSLDQLLAAYQDLIQAALHVQIVEGWVRVKHCG